MATDRPMSAHNTLRTQKCQKCTELEEQTLAHARAGEWKAAEYGYTSEDGEHWACYGDHYFDPDGPLPPYEGTYERADLDRREATYFEEPHHG